LGTSGDVEFDPELIWNLLESPMVVDILQWMASIHMHPGINERRTVKVRDMLPFAQFCAVLLYFLFLVSQFIHCM